MTETKNTGLSALAAQYAADAENLEKMIAACNERRRLALRRGNSKEARRLERLAELHAQQRRDLLKLSAQLRHYYDGEEGLAWAEDS